MRLTAGVMTLALVLSGCAGTPHQPRPLPPDVASVIGVPAAETETFGEPDAGLTTPDSRFADLKPSTAAVARRELHVVVYDRELRAHRVQFSLPVAKMDYVALVNYGNMGHLRQVHLFSGVGKVVLSYGITETQAAEALVQKLVSLGVRQGTAPTRYIQGPGEAGAFPLIVPILRR